jgi:hypothetical protein
LTCASECVKVALRNALTQVMHVVHDSMVLPRIFRSTLQNTCREENVSSKNMLHEATNYMQFRPLQSRLFSEWVVNTQLG